MLATKRSSFSSEWRQPVWSSSVGCVVPIFIERSFEKKLKWLKKVCVIFFADQKKLSNDEGPTSKICILHLLQLL